MNLALPLILACAPTVAPSTVARVVAVESGGNPLAIHVNGLLAQPSARTPEGAVRIVARYVAQGRSVDMGLMQVNTANLARLGYSVLDMFDPCRNLAAGSAILTGNYLTAKAAQSDPQHALRAALSAYNTGSFTAGFRNGYVGRYLRGPARLRFDEGSAAVLARLSRPTDAPAASRILDAPEPLADPYTAETAIISNWSTQ